MSSTPQPPPSTGGPGPNPRDPQVYLHGLGSQFESVWASSQVFEPYPRSLSIPTFPFAAEPARQTAATRGSHHAHEGPSSAMNIDGKMGTVPTINHMTARRAPTIQLPAVDRPTSTSVRSAPVQATETKPMGRGGYQSIQGSATRAKSWT